MYYGFLQSFLFAFALLFKRHLRSRHNRLVAQTTNHIDLGQLALHFSVQSKSSKQPTKGRRPRL